MENLKITNGKRKKICKECTNLLSFGIFLLHANKCSCQISMAVLIHNRLWLCYCRIDEWIMKHFLDLLNSDTQSGEYNVLHGQLRSVEILQKKKRKTFLIFCQQEIDDFYLPEILGGMFISLS